MLIRDPRGSLFLSASSTRQVAKLRVPLTIMPGNLSDERIDLLA